MGTTAHIKLTVIAVSAAFLLIVGSLLDLQYLYLMAAALAVLPLASNLLAQRLATRFHALREHTETAEEGHLVPITLHIRAEGGLPQASIRVSDGLPADLVTTDEGNSALPLDQWDGQNGSRTYHVEPDRRGVYSLGPIRVTTTDPLGLFGFPVTIDNTTQIIVHPTPLPARHSSVGGEGTVGAREREGKTHRGEGMDFHGVREYRQGDALRRVHWPTTARTGQLAVVEFERAFQQDIVVALDLQRGTEHGSGRETTLEYAVKVAATLADRTLCSGGGVTLITQAGRVTVRPRDADPAVGRFRLFDLLARIRTEADYSLADSLRAARLAAGTHFEILTAQGDAQVTTYLAERIPQGDTLRVFFFEPASFGGPSVPSPAVLGGQLVVVRREYSPWEEGGRKFEYLLREDE